MSQPKSELHNKKSIADRILDVSIKLIYGKRWLSFGLMLAMTIFLGWHALHLKPDAGYEKQFPTGHPYMKVFQQYQKSFGGANLISIALMQQDGDIYNAEYLDRLKKLTDSVFFLPGVDRTRVSSLFTPDLIFFDVIEGGINLGNIVPRNYNGSPEMLSTVRGNVAKSGLVGRYVANDQNGALIVAELLEHHPVTGEKLDYHRLANQLEDQLRRRISSKVMYEYHATEEYPPYKVGDVIWRGYTDYGWKLRFQTFEAEQKTSNGDSILVAGDKVTVTTVANPDYSPKHSVHIIGFAKVLGDVTDASTEVVSYFFIALILIFLLLWGFCRSIRLSLLPMYAALAAVIWELGLLRLANFGLDPFAILVPFLILSIGVSHGVQYINGFSLEISENNRDPLEASIATFRRLFLPGTVAIITNVLGFATLAFINIPIVREMAINAALGMAAVIVTNKVMLPVALSWVKIKDLESFRATTRKRNASGAWLWQKISALAEPKGALIVLAASAAALAWAIYMYPKLTIGDSESGVPELKPNSVYNIDSGTVTANFSIGVDILKVMAETERFGCIKYSNMEYIENYTWTMQNTPGVQLAIALPTIAKEVRGLWNENALKWKVLPRNQDALAHLVGRIPSSVGLQNLDCSVMPILIFTTDHRATTLSGVIKATEDYIKNNPDPGIKLKLASGNAGVMAATNEEIKASEIIVVVWVHLTLLIFVWISFRSWQSVVCIITPLVLCSLLTYACMATWGIGMKSATLPVAAFGVGIGVDDGIYLWGALTRSLGEGRSLRSAFETALAAAGKATTLTSLALIASVGTWLFSGLQFQADMGLLLVFMFSTNLLGAILMMPALGWICNKISPLTDKGGLISH